MIKQGFILFIISIHAVVVYSQKLYSLHECYQLGLDRNLTLQRAQNKIYSDVIDRKTAQGNLLPSLTGNMGHFISFGKNIDPVTNDFVTERFSGGYMSLGLQQRLFAGFGRINAIKQSAYIIKSAEYAKKRTELEILSNITLTYARVLLNKEQIEVSKENIKSTTKELNIVKEKIKVGRLTKYEYYTFNARLNSEQATLVTIQNDLSAAIQNLKELLNLPYKDELDVAPIDTSALALIYVSQFISADLVESILQKHPALKEAKMAEQAALLGEKIARSDRYPYFTIGANINSNYNAAQRNVFGAKIPLGTQLNENLGRNINFGLRLPIFSQTQFANAIKKEKINIANAQIATQEAQNSIVSNTIQLINDFNAAKQKYTATLSAFEQNNLSYMLYEEKYRLGQISSVELLTARDILNASTSDYLQSRLELYFRYQLVELLKRN